jgi:hypothetical protein
MKDFIGIMLSEKISYFEQTANEYPIIDAILLTYFKKIVPITFFISEEQIEYDINIAQKVFAYLSEIFEVTYSKI